jgi:uncharacterized protein GlcG (DUF336 family)
MNKKTLKKIPPPTTNPPTHQRTNQYIKKQTNQHKKDGCNAGAYASFSHAKARTCIHLNTSSRGFREKYTTGEAALFTQASCMVTVMQGDLLPIAGGVLIQSVLDGSVVGAVGVSGAAADEDEYLALLGVQVGLNQYIENNNDNNNDNRNKEQPSQLQFATIPTEHCCKTLRR